MQLVTVTATQPFTHEGASVQAGDPVSTTAINAALLAQAGKVSLARRSYRAQVLRPSLPSIFFDESMKASRSRRQYRRADMVAED